VVDNWRIASPACRWRSSGARHHDGPGVLIVEGTWHESQRPDAADPIDW